MTPNPKHHRALESQAYELFSRLVLRGLTPELVEHVRAIDELAGDLSAFERDGALDFDEAAAAHEGLFGARVFPLQSVFLDPSGYAGGVETQRVLDGLARVGVRPDPTADPADHLGQLLSALAHLTAAEAEAEEDGHPDEAARMRTLSAELLDRHLLRWLPALSAAVARERPWFFGPLTELVVELAAHHRDALLATRPVEPPPPLAGDTPDLAALLGAEDTGLRQIVDHLLTPAASGAYLSAATLAELGRAHRLPRGFGARAQVLKNLFTAAVDYDRVPQLVERLVDEVERAANAYAAWTSARPASVAPFAEPWRRRAEATVRALQTMAKATI